MKAMLHFGSWRSPRAHVIARRVGAAMLATASIACAPLPATAAQPSGATHPATDGPPYTGYDAAVRALYTSSLLAPSGDPQSLTPYRGKVTVVNFWASWCAPCVKEMPALSELQRRYADKGVRFVGIGVDSAKNVSQFLSKVTIDYPVYIAGFGGTELARQLGNHAGGLPFTVVIDKAGHVRYSRLGEIDPVKLGSELDAL